MMTRGHDDGAGDFAFRVGLPEKSGVGIGDGFLAIVPRKAVSFIWSPCVNAHGNSIPLLGTADLERLTQRTGGSVFG